MDALFGTGASQFPASGFQWFVTTANFSFQAVIEGLPFCAVFSLVVETVMANFIKFQPPLCVDIARRGPGQVANSKLPRRSQPSFGQRRNAAGSHITCCIPTLKYFRCAPSIHSEEGPQPGAQRMQSAALSYIF